MSFQMRMQNCAYQVWRRDSIREVLGSGDHAFVQEHRVQVTEVGILLQEIVQNRSLGRKVLFAYPRTSNVMVRHHLMVEF